MGVVRHSTRSWSKEHAARDRALNAAPDPKPCVLCGDLARGGRLCPECAERARPYEPGDPYDDLGGEN